MWIGVAVAVLAGGLAAAPAATATTGDPSMRTAVIDQIAARAGRPAADLTAAGRGFQVNVSRTTAGWSFGSAVLTAPRTGHAHPDGWLFVARRGAGGWTAALDGTAAFDTLSERAPAAIVTGAERSVLGTRSRAKARAAASNNTGLSLPYAVGQTWTLTGGPHGWAGSERPFSSLDLAGGDGQVLAPGDGVVYTMCGNNLGWLRIYHPTGYTTDYYHLWNNIQPADGSNVTAGTFLGNIGTDVSCGGSASGPHVHWAVLEGETRVPWHGRSAGQWVFSEGASAYGGYATHGDTRVDVGGGLFNHGALGADAAAPAR
jgi:LasA protease